MFTETDFLKIMQFLKDNESFNVTNKKEVPVNLLTQKTFLYDDEATTLKQSLNWDNEKGLSSDQLGLAQIALLSKARAQKYFKNVLNQVAFNTEDWSQATKMITDWYSANMTYIDVMKRSSDPFSLSDDHLDLAIKGFGAEVINKNSVPDKYKRALFLLALANLYKIKGTPESLYQSLSFINYHNAQIREWWVKKDSTDNSKLSYEGRVIKRGQLFNDESGQYELIDSKEYDLEVLGQEEFEFKKSQIADPHWWYRSEEILSIENNSQTKIKLPSITPYFSVVVPVDIQRLNIVLGIAERLLTDQFNSLLNGNQIREDIILSSYSDKISFLSLYLGFAYCNLVAADLRRYESLKTYLLNSTSDEINVKESDFSSIQGEYRYEQLILWINDNPEKVSLVSLSDYNVPDLYFGARNDLISWWDTLNREGDPPSIFSSHFKYPTELVNFSDLKIQCYNGQHDLTLIDNIIAKKVFKEYEDLLNEPFVREKRDVSDPTFVASNFLAEPRTMIEVQRQFSKLSTQKVSDEICRFDDIKHDGSQLKPNSNGSYKQWAVDDEYYYFCISNNNWVRYEIEKEWEDVDVIPYNSFGDNIITVGNKSYDNKIGCCIPYNGYVYRHVACDKWIRSPLTESWNNDTVNLPTSKGYIGDLKITDDYIYECLFETNKWIRHDKDITWTTNDPDRQKIYSSSEASFPILNLKNRYSARKILSGYAPIKSSLSLRLYKGLIENQEVIVTHQTDKIEISIKQIQRIDSLTARIFIESENVDFINNTDSVTCPILTTELLKVISCNENNGSPYITVEYDNSSNGEFAEPIQGFIERQYIPCQMPVVYKWNSLISRWQESDTPLASVSIGANNAFLNWIRDTNATAEEYQNVADNLLIEFSTYLVGKIRISGTDLADSYSRIQSNQIFLDIIEFFKPKRARLLYFGMYIEIKDRLHESISLSENNTLLNETVNFDDFIRGNKQSFDGINTDVITWKTSPRTPYFELNITKIEKINSTDTKYTLEEPSGLYMDLTSLSINDNFFTTLNRVSKPNTVLNAVIKSTGNNYVIVENSNSQYALYSKSPAKAKIHEKSMYWMKCGAVDFSDLPIEAFYKNKKLIENVDYTYKIVGLAPIGAVKYIQLNFVPDQDLFLKPSILQLDTQILNEYPLTQDYVSSTGIIRRPYTSSVPAKIFKDTGTYTLYIECENDNHGLLFEVFGKSRISLSDFSIKRVYKKGNEYNFTDEEGNDLLFEDDSYIIDENYSEDVLENIEYYTDSSKWFTRGSMSVENDIVHHKDANYLLGKFYGRAYYPINFSFDEMDKTVSSSKLFRIKFTLTNIDNSYLNVSFGGKLVTEEDPIIINNNLIFEEKYSKGIPAYHFDYMNIYDSDDIVICVRENDSEQIQCGERIYDTECIPKDQYYPS